METESKLSKVAEGGQGKLFGGIIFGGIVVLMLAWSFLGGHKEVAVKKDPSLKPGYEEVSPQVGATASPMQTEARPQPNSDQEDRIAALKAKLMLDKLAMEEKMYRSRQQAQISMYQEGNRSGALEASPTDGGSVPMASNEYGKLPLSTKDAEKLKKMMEDPNPNSQFQSRAANQSVEHAQATIIEHPSFVVTQGTLIPGSLETAINSDLPGMVKSNVSSDVYSTDGKQVLIPKSSILIGQYSAGVNMGQKRVFVIWTRLIRPDHVDVMLGSPGTDALGAAGLGADKIDTHFWDRFGQATLLSILSAGIATAGVDPDGGYNSASEYRAAVSDSFSEASQASLYATINIKPTIFVNQGAKINVFVNRDLSFYEALTGQ